MCGPSVLHVLAPPNENVPQPVRLPRSPVSVNKTYLHEGPKERTGFCDENGNILRLI